MTEPTDSSPEKSPPTPKKLNPAVILGATLALIALIYGAWVYFGVKPQGEIDPLFEHPIFSELTPNEGLSDLYQPGNVLQIIQDDGQGGEQRLAFPRLFLRASDCFPDLPIDSSPFALPGGDTGKIAGSGLARLLPGLDLSNEAAAQHSLQVKRARLLTTTRPDLSRKFAPLCVDALRQVLVDGEKIEWFAVVERALVADAVSFEIEWSSQMSAGGELDPKKLAQKTDDALAGIGAEVKTSGESDRKKTYELEGTLVLGYDARPLAPVYQELPPPSETVRGSLSLLLVEGRSSTPVDFEHGFRPGDFFRFEVTAESEGWLSVLSRPSEDAESVLLWPDADEEAKLVSPGMSVVIPASPNAFQFAEGTENETFYITLAGRPDAAGSETPEDRDPEEIVDIVVRGLTISLEQTRSLDAMENSLAAQPVRRFEASAGEDGVAAIALRLRREGESDE